MRYSTGIKQLNDLMEGGIPEKSAVMLLGPPGAGKSTFTFEMTYTNLNDKVPCIYLTTNDKPDMVRRKMLAFNFDISKHADLMIFIDGYSWRRSPGNSGGYLLKSITNLTDAIITIKTAMKDNDFKNGLFIIDSLSDFLLYNEPQELYKFLQIITAEIKKTNSVGLVSIEEDLHDQKAISTLSYLTDGVMKMKTADGQRQLQIQKMPRTKHKLGWVNFTINKGIELYVQEFFE
ncbi:MAG: AAA family ATPase [DPANN group archaeon]|nr:AAA family ATPase [DPANN group archaeon]